MRTLALLALTGCTHISDLEHQQHLAEIAAGDDTGVRDLSALAGRWTGPFVIDIELLSGDVVEVPPCEGEMTATLSADGSKLAVEGGGSCESTDWVQIDAEIEGAVDVQLVAQGQVTLNTEGGETAQPSWTGAVDPSETPRLSGTFSFDFELALRQEGRGDGRFDLDFEEP